MGFSKKKQKNFRKAQARVGPKAKEKAKEKAKIESREQIKASKRKAAEVTSAKAEKERASEAGDLLGDVRSVDALFARMGKDEESDAEDDGAGSDSSAGIFHAPDDAASDDGSDEDDAGLPPDLEHEDEGDEEAGAKHAEDLKALKEKDPEFYKFLVAEDKALLDFREDDAAKESGQPEEDDKEDTARQQDGKTLTMERLKRIQEAAPTSFTACKAALNFYHTAVRSIESGGAQAADSKGDNADGAEKAPRRRRGGGLLRIEDEAVFSEVLEWSVASIPGLLRVHAGELKAEPGGRGKRRNKQRKARESAEDLAEASGATDVTLFSRWPRVKVLAQIFWDETYFLLTHLVAQHMLEFVLRNCSGPEALSWLWPFRHHRSRFFRRSCALWSTAPAHNVRLLAFLFIRNASAMALTAPAPAPRGHEREAAQLEAIVRHVLKSFAEASSRGYSWRAFSTFRFMENCLVELLRLDGPVAYRVGYAYIRQLALILRNACLGESGAGGGKDKGKTKTKEEKRGNFAERRKQKMAAEAGGAAAEGGNRKKEAARHQQAQQGLITWPFVRSAYFWTKAVSTVPALRPLAYPLFMVILGAVKSKLTALNYFPFVYHCLFCLNRLGSTLESFVPISSHLLKSFDVLFQAMDKAKKKKGDTGSKGGIARAPELEVLLRLSEGQVMEALTLETVGSSLCFLFTDHLGLLSQSPSFPEISATVMLHLKKHSKHCSSESLRHQLKNLVASAEASAEDIRSRRETLAEAPSFKKFLLFAPDSAIAKARAAALKRRVEEDRSRVEAETREDRAAASGRKKGAKDPRGAADGGIQEEAPVEAAPGQGTSKKALKRKRLREAKEKLESKAADERSEMRKRARGGTAAEAAGDPGKDVVEEMGFSESE